MSDRISDRPRIFAYCRATAAVTVNEQLRQISSAGWTPRQDSIVVAASSADMAGRCKDFAAMLVTMHSDDIVLIAGLDILGRSAGEVLRAIEKCEESAVALYCAAIGHIDLAGKDGEAIRRTVQALAVCERDLRIEHTQAAMVRARGKLLKPRPMTLSPAQKAEIAAKLTAGVPLAKLARDYRTTRQVIMRVRKASADENERVVTIPAEDAPRHAIEAVAMLARGPKLAR